MARKTKAQLDAEQTAAINSGPAPRDPFDAPDGDDGTAAARNAMAQFLGWQGNVLQRLGLDTVTGNVKADNHILLSSLQFLAANGAPTPTVVTETIAWPGGIYLDAGAFTVDVYEFEGNGHTLRSSEFLLAAGPSRVLTELRTLGIIS